MKAILAIVLSVMVALASGRSLVSGGAKGPASLTVSESFIHEAAAVSDADAAVAVASDETTTDVDEEDAAPVADADAEAVDAEEEAPALLEASAEAPADMAAGVFAEVAAARPWPGHSRGPRDDVSGGFGSRKFYAPKGKGCYIELNNCPRFPHVPTNKPFADGWSHKTIGNGWFGPRAAEKRCLARAAEYFWWCNGGQGTTVTATWRSSGRSRSAPDVGCWINQFACVKHPQYRGRFYDTFDGARSSMNQARCFQRAREYHRWCGNPKSITTTAEYRPTKAVQDYPAEKGCFISGVSCPAHPSGNPNAPAQATTGYFRDHWGEQYARTGVDEKACLARAQQYHAWCNAPMDETFTAEFKPTGRTKTYPRNLMAPISFVEVATHGAAKCKTPNANTLVVSAVGAEGACTVPFSALKVPKTKSLANTIITFDVHFLKKPGHAVGRHGGIFFGSHESGRQDNAVIDWIDRSFDRGYRVYGMRENNKWSKLTPANNNPTQRWTIIVDGAGNLQFRAGDQQWTAKVSQHELSQPNVGFWAWPGNRMKVSNFNIRPYQARYKFVDMEKAGVAVKGNAQVSPVAHGLQLTSLGREGSAVMSFESLGLPNVHSLANKRISFDIEFVRGQKGAGRHGGVFFGPGPNGRYNGNAAIDWIEAGASRGYRVYWQMSNEKWDYWSPKAKRADTHWEIAIDKKFRLQFTAGDVNWNSRLSAAWNGGYLGFWVYNGVQMRVRNLLITDLEHNVCSAAPCLNGGACEADGNDFTCKCAAGFSGADCSIALNRCTPRAIQSCNGGKCVNGAKEYTCDCSGTGFVGKRCNGKKLAGWFRADDQATVVVGSKELVGSSSSRAEVIELNTAAKPGQTVTIKARNTGGKGMIVAWLKFRGADLVTGKGWECSDSQGASWAPATVLGSQGMDGWGRTANMPDNAAYIWSANADAKSTWCRVTLPAQTFKSGDRVKLDVKSTVSAFCARSSPASTTTYFGTVCGNGGVRWTHYAAQFSEVRSELRGQMDQCARARAGASDADVKKYFGDCDSVPTILSDNALLTSAVASAIKGLQLETNPCADTPCGRRATCEWALNGPFPFKCSCPTGYSGTGAPWEPCQSQDVCATSTPCHKNARCHKTGAGKFSCRCKTGFAGNGKHCVEVNPCKAGVSPCSPNATCKHIGPGKASCTCNAGFKGDGKKCSEVDVCATKNPCKGAGAKCEKTGAGKYQCSCKAGHVLDGDTCHVASACHPSPCAKGSATCSVLSNGKAACACRDGFKGDGKLCTAINPCDEKGGASLCSANAMCKSAGPGKHKCVCAKGFKGDGKTCAPVDACADSKPCSGNAICKSTGPGTYSCTCKAGFAGNGHHCKVADACDAKPCSPYATCETTGPNKHVCTCKAGYSGDGTKCTPVDACKASPCHAQATCRMTGPGTKVCTCNPGFSGSGEQCEPVNACASNPCTNAKCSVTAPGKYKCECNNGFTTKGSNNPDVCVERNNCNADKSPCGKDQVCKVTGPGTHKCVCKWGFRGKDNEACTEIDKCAEDKPCSANAMCQKTGPGTFLCTCNKNFVGDGITCREVDNCKKAVYPCHKDARCAKTGPGQHSCTCKPGFDGDGVLACVAHDNCVSNPCPANSVCEVTGPGQNRCVPRPGFAFTDDRKSTVEIDNCKAAKSPCHALATCEKTGPGAHKCTCKAGYHGDGVTCAPVDMCQTGPCDARATCKNTGAGKYACTCKAGHTGDGSKGHCDEINLCSTKNPCDAHATCTKTGPGRAACECAAGYFGNGLKCAEVDNCKKTPSVCAANAVCQKTGPGTHKCECKPGYKGDGLTCRYDTTEIDHHDSMQRDAFDRVEKLLPKVNRVVFDGHDAVQDAAVSVAQDALDRTAKHVDALATSAARTDATLQHIAKAMKAVRDNTVEHHVIHAGPSPLQTGVTDAATALPKIGDVADARPLPPPRDAGVTRIAAARPPVPPPAAAQPKKA